MNWVVLVTVISVVLSLLTHEPTRGRLKARLTQAMVKSRPELNLCSLDGFSPLAFTLQASRDRVLPCHRPLYAFSDPHWPLEQNWL